MGRCSPPRASPGFDAHSGVVFPAGAKTASEALQHPYWRYLGGEVLRVTRKQLDAMPEGERRAFLESARTGQPVVAKVAGKGRGKRPALPKKEGPAGVTSTSRPMTNVEGTNDDGTDCRT